MKRATSTAPGTKVKRSGGGEPKRPVTSAAKLRPPIRRAPACAQVRSMASRCVSQHEPTQCPSPPWIETRLGAPVRREARSVAQPVG